jgi:hypothetical protein
MLYQHLPLLILEKSLPVIFDPWIRDPDPGWKKSGSGMNILDNFARSLETFLGLKYLNSLMRIRIRNLFDPGSGMEKFKNPGSGLNIPDQLYFTTH